MFTLLVTVLETMVTSVNNQIRDVELDKTMNTCVKIENRNRVMTIVIRIMF